MRASRSLNSMKKIINIGRVPHAWRSREIYTDIFCSVKIENGKLSISGVIGPMKNGDAIGSCGQIDETIRTYWDNKEIIFSDGWDDALLDEFLNVWDRWHLNDMRAGCEHQRALGWEKEGYDAHPSEACPTCGYKFGTAWKFEELPQRVVLFLESLPETKKEPAWV